MKFPSTATIVDALFMSELFSCLKKEDENGTYVLKTNAITIEDVQRYCFKSYYVSPSFVKINFIKKCVNYGRRRREFHANPLL